MATKKPATAKPRPRPVARKVSENNRSDNPPDRRNTEAAEAAAADNAEPFDDAPFYCPGCGRRAKYEKECRGSDTAPHPPIDVVSTDELRPSGDHPHGDPSKHTPAPATE